MECETFHDSAQSYAWYTLEYLCHIWLQFVALQAHMLNLCHLLMFPRLRSQIPQRTHVCTYNTVTVELYHVCPHRVLSYFTIFPNALWIIVAWRGLVSGVVWVPSVNDVTVADRWLWLIPEFVSQVHTLHNFCINKCLHTLHFPSPQTQCFWLVAIAFLFALSYLFST